MGTSGNTRTGAYHLKPRGTGQKQNNLRDSQTGAGMEEGPCASSPEGERKFYTDVLHRNTVGTARWCRAHCLYCTSPQSKHCEAHSKLVECRKSCKQADAIEGEWWLW